MQELQIESVPDSLKNFLKPFNFKKITISVQPESGLEGVRIPEGNWFSPKNRVRAIPIEQFYSEEVQAELQNCQMAGCAIYFLINEGNGEPTDLASGNFNCGKRVNIITLKALVIDTDNANYLDLVAKLKSIGLVPHYYVESSPNKYHFYFLIKDLPAEGDNVLQWTALQKYLDDLIPNLDQTMVETNQVLRLPTFYNLKPTLEKPFKIRIAGEAGIDRLPYHDLKFLYDRLEAFKYNDSTYVNGIGTFKETYTKFEFPKTKLNAGERRDKICRYIEHVMENRLPLHAPEEEYFHYVNNFIRDYIKPNEQHDFLEGGSRRQNLINYFNDQRNYRIKKNQAVEELKQSQQLDHVDAVSDSKLPDTFYKNFPGDLGFITKEISDYAPNLPQELCFAGALAISGMLKAETFRFKGAWPFVNGLIVAGTGVGKSAVKDIVERTLASAGLRGQYSQVLGFQNSVQSLHTSLYAAGGAGIVMIDESGDYLSTITSKNAPGYAKALKKYFKEATTGKDEGTWLHPGGSLSYQVPPINGGMLSLWMLIQPDKFESSMSLEDMADGFLPRFFVFNGKSKIKLTRTFNEDIDYKSFTPSIDFKVYLESLSQRMPYTSTNSVTEEVEKALKETTPKIKADILAAAKRDAVYTARSEARKLGNSRIEVKIDDDAKSLVQEYLNERELEANKAQSKDGNDPTLGIYIRIEEMLLRLMCNAVSWNSVTKEARIDYTLAKACIQFHRFQTDRFFRNELAEISKGTGERDMDTVLAALKKVFHAKGKDSVKIGDISEAIRSTKRPKNISFVVQELVKRGQVLLEMKANPKQPMHKTPHYFPVETPEVI